MKIGDKEYALTAVSMGNPHVVTYVDSLDFDIETIGKQFEKDKIFNASTCGDNCAKWLLKIAETEDRTINLHHLMDFGDEKFTIHIANTDQIVHSMEELVSIAGEFV